MESRPTGHGKLGIRWLMKVFQAREWDCSAILELRMPLEATLNETIAKEQRLAEERIVFSKRWITG